MGFILQKKVLLFLIGVVAGAALFSNPVFAHIAKDENAIGDSRKAIITITDEGFLPSKIVIHRGVEVTFIQEGENLHWPASNMHPTHEILSDFDSLRPLKKGESWSFVFLKSGEWKFHDHLFPLHGGVIVVIDETQKELNIFDIQEKFILAEFFKEVPQVIKSVLESIGFGSIFNPFGYNIQAQHLVERIVLSQNQEEREGMVRDLAKYIGPENAMEVLKDSGLPFIGENHLLAHVIGNVAYKRYGEDALGICKNYFLNGCQHAVVIDTLSDKGFEGVARLVDRCRDQGSVVYYQCFHGAGHAFDAWLDYDVFEGVKLCDKLAKTKTELLYCHTGVFMENIFGMHGGEQLAFENLDLKTEDPYYPCNAVDERYKKACYVMQSTQIHRLSRGDMKKVAQICAEAEPSYREECFFSMGRDIHAKTKGNPEKEIVLCNVAPVEYRKNCISAVAANTFWGGFGETENALTLCRLVQSNEEKQYCYATIIQGLGRSDMDVKERNEICNQMEEPFTRACIDGGEFSVLGASRPQNQIGDINQKNNFQSLSLVEQERIVREKAEMQGAQFAYEFLQKAFLGPPSPDSHNLAHVIGEYAHNEAGLAGIGLCEQDFLFGCYHGFFIELVIHEGTGVLEKSKEACGLLYEGSYLPCIHGIGHGIFDYEGDIQRSLTQCTFFGGKDEFYCQTGVFMANIMSKSFLENSRLSNDVTLNLCREVEEKFKPACYIEQGAGVYLDSGSNFTSALKACREVNQEHYRSLCFRGIARFVVVAKDNSFDMIKQCRLFVPGGFENCIETVVRQLTLGGRDVEAEELCGYLEAEEQVSCQEDIEITKKAFL